MGLYVQILLGVLLLAALVFTFLGARTWHWGHVLVVLGIFLSTLGFFLLAAETLRINAVLRNELNRVERDLADMKARNEALAEGTRDASLIARMQGEDPPVLVAEGAESMASLSDMKHELLVATRRRGPVWRNAAPAGVDPKTSAIAVTIPTPVPAGLRPDSVVYIFEQGPAQPPAADGTPQGPQYLGAFRVTASQGQQATLAPVLPMAPFEQARLAASRGPWAIYERMPPDRHSIFAGKTAEELKQILPPQVVEEYLRHGTEARPDDPDELKVGVDADGNPLKSDQMGKAVKVVYQRRLRDYATEFDELAQRRIVMEADVAAVMKDIERLQAANESAKKLHAFRQDEIQRLKTDLAGISKERKAIEGHLAQVEQQLARVRQLLAATLKRNSELANELAARQLRSGPPVDGAQSPEEASDPLAMGTLN
jgi:hypothetical protein